jgi:hypothetical protein
MRIGIFERPRGATAIRRRPSAEVISPLLLLALGLSECAAVRRARGEIDSPEKKARAAVVQSTFDTTDASLRARRFGGGPATHTPLAAVEQRPLLTATSEQLIYVRVKENLK